MKLVVGLGNPGKKYDQTRHNVGFEIVELLARRFGGGSPKAKFDGQLVDIAISGEVVWLLWPRTYMNLSGRAVRAAADFYKLDLGDLLVVCDDFNLELGKIRLRARGSSGGQKGLDSIIQQLGTEEFSRLRVAVGPVPPQWDPADFVLSRFNQQERETIDKVTTTAADAVECWVSAGIDEAMNRFN